MTATASPPPQAPERVTLTDVERGYAFIGDGIHWRGRWYSELAVESIVSHRLAAREQALRDQIAGQIEADVLRRVAERLDNIPSYVTPRLYADDRIHAEGRDDELENVVDFLRAEADRIEEGAR